MLRIPLDAIQSIIPSSGASKGVAASFGRAKDDSFPGMMNSLVGKSSNAQAPAIARKDAVNTDSQHKDIGEDSQVIETHASTTRDAVAAHAAQGKPHAGDARSEDTANLQGKDSDGGSSALRGSRIRFGGNTVMHSSASHIAGNGFGFKAGQDSEWAGSTSLRAGDPDAEDSKKLDENETEVVTAPSIADGNSADASSQFAEADQEKLNFADSLKHANSEAMSAVLDDVSAGDEKTKAASAASSAQSGEVSSENAEKTGRWKHTQRTDQGMLFVQPVIHGADSSSAVSAGHASFVVTSQTVVTPSWEQVTPGKDTSRVTVPSADASFRGQSSSAQLRVDPKDVSASGEPVAGVFGNASDAKSDVEPGHDVKRDHVIDSDVLSDAGGHVVASTGLSGTHGEAVAASVLNPDANFRSSFLNDAVQHAAPSAMAESLPKNEGASATEVVRPLRHLAVDFQDDAIGQVSVRAEMRDGMLHASVTGLRSDSLVNASSLHEFLQQSQVQVHNVSIEAHNRSSATQSFAGDPASFAGNGETAQQYPQQQTARGNGSGVRGDIASSNDPVGHLREPARITTAAVSVERGRLSIHI